VHSSSFSVFGKKNTLAQSRVFAPLAEHARMVLKEERS
jgi:hypothetical protein